jgi:phosphomannomutase/phosphoglucomutase
LLAGEMSGHIFFKERWYGFDDAFYSGARLLEVMVLKASDRSVSDVFDALPDSINTPELNIKMQEGESHAFIEELAAKAKFENANVITIDGLRVELDDGWGLIRASNTTPVLVLRFEADNEAALQRIQDMFREQIKALKPDMELPF